MEIPKIDNSDTVVLSSKYQFVVPKRIRSSMNLKPGKKYVVFSVGDTIQIVPQKDPKDLFGFIKNINSRFFREKDDRI